MLLQEAETLTTGPPNGLRCPNNHKYCGTEMYICPSGSPSISYTRWCLSDTKDLGKRCFEYQIGTWRRRHVQQYSDYWQTDIYTFCKERNFNVWKRLLLASKSIPRSWSGHSSFDEIFPSPEKITGSWEQDLDSTICVYNTMATMC